MTLLPLHEDNAWMKNVTLVASDMDGTMTRGGRFHAPLMKAFDDAAEAGIRILLITGRSAGWVQGLAGLLPIAGAVAENGGIFYRTDGEDAGTELTEMPQGRAAHRRNLEGMFRVLQREFPRIEEAPDNVFRITDWTYSVAGLSPADLERMAALCAGEGFNFTYSNVQCHILPSTQEKATGLRKLLTGVPEFRIATQSLVTIGDSPNDESLFDASLFPNSVGVANLVHYRERLAHLPRHVTRAHEGAGFVELIEALIAARK